jgi:signal transduction histidine kinase/DNA-binding response OmpR family regulator/HPt (histidine-containing phosphotransfer) domain-containing protein
MSEERTVPAFPMRAVVVGIIAMILIAGASAVTTWVVGERVRTITNSQIAVLMAAERLQHQSELLELSARMAIATGDEAYARRYGAIRPELRRTLSELQKAIQLPENRATFAAVDAAEREISGMEYGALDLAVTDRRGEAQAILENPRYTQLARTYRQGLVQIEERSRGYVDANRRETNRYLTINLAASFVGLVLIGLAWVVLVRPARAWARQLADARRRAESATRAKSEFLAMMSHEIRTPLNSIIGFADLLLTDTAVQGAQRRQVELIQGAGTMLLTVVNDALDFSKIEAGRIELLPEPFALETLIDNSVSIVRATAEAKGLELRVDADPCLSPFFLGDENRLRQVLLNLLNNAVKFTASGLVALSVRREKRDGDHERLRFTVTDTGLGIEADQQSRLFQPFSQADASITRRFGGTGLGLSISKRLIELMGGEIGFHSKEGSGSSFWFCVSLPRAEAPELLRESDLVSAKGGAHILLAEDLPMNQELARAMIGRMGHALDIAHDGLEAVEKVAARDYDLVLMDIQMPRMDGITATKRIRSLGGAAADVPIVAMTANVLPEQVREFFAAGMNGHVPKPVRQAELHAAISAALAGRPSRRMAQSAPAAPEAPSPAAPPAAAEPPAAPEDAGAAAFDRAVFDDVRQMLPPERLAAYLEGLAGQVEQVAAGPDAAGGTDALAGTAHKIVSQAGMLGLPRLSERARAVEEAAREGAGPALDSALARFREAAIDLGEAEKALS